MMSSHSDSFVASGSSPTPTGSDFICQNHGSLFLLIPLSPPASTWIEENLPSDRMTFGDAVAIEPRYVWAILSGLQEDGLTVSP
jgi:hypothetical protein